MDKIWHVIKSPPVSFVVGGLVTLALDARTNGKVSETVASVPLLGKLVFGK
jgi:hypothetical protein